MAEPTHHDNAEYLEYQIYAEDEAQRAEQKLKEAFKAIVDRLTKLADDQVIKKKVIEDRWLLDLRQYYGLYDVETEANLNSDDKKSKLFVNLTRPKTHGWQARLNDMLFPTDDKNWGVRPTPVPKLAIKGVTDQQAQGEQSDEQKQADEVDAARTRADAMEQEIDDQFTEAKFQIKSRDTIDDGCLIGTGIIKGPVVSAKSVRRWGLAVDGPDRGQYVLGDVDDPMPDFFNVDPWSFFPDMSASSVEEAEFFFERHLKNKKELRRLAKIKGFDKDEIRALLKEGPADGMPLYINEMRSITEPEQQQDDEEKKYHVWEYNGALDREDIETLCTCLGRDEMMEDIGDDILDEVQVVVWFCQGRVIKFGFHLLDSGDPIYSVFSLEKDKQSIFGFGVPKLMRDSQKAMNAGWRMMMDNSGLSVGPQVVVDTDSIEPVDGKYELTPHKVWRKKSDASGVPIDNAFSAFHIDSRQAELANIITMARQFIDEETSLPLVAQGESGSHQTQTAQGMSMLMNSVNVVFRRVVKNWDDDVTIPVVTRTYDWNMQFNARDDIKGDYKVDARGSSVLLVREMQAQNLLAMMNMFGAHPVYGPMTKHADLYRKTVQAHSIGADEIVLSDAEIEAWQKQQAEAGQNSPEQMKLQTELQIAKMDSDVKIMVAQLTRDTEMMRLATSQNITLDKIKADLEKTRINQDGKERILAAEAAVQQRSGKDNGSGGYV